MASNYEVRVADLCGFSLSSARTIDLYQGQIVRVSTGKVAYKTRSYHEARTARLQASRLVKNYEHHLAKHGVGFEEQEEQRKADFRAKLEAAKTARHATTKAAPELLAALQQIAPDHPLAVNLSWPDLPKR